jgi:MscS family membrane protein
MNCQDKKGQTTRSFTANHRAASLLLQLFLLVVGSSFSTNTHAACESPRAAARSLTDNLQADGVWSPEQAASCFPTGTNNEQLALQLKQIIDARGLYLDLDNMPIDPGSTNTAGEHSLVLHKGEPRIKVTKTDELWIYSPDTISAIPAMYAQSFSGIARTLRQTLPPPFHKPILLGVQGWQVTLFTLLILISVLAGRIAHWLLAGQIIRMASKFRVELSENVIEKMQAPLTWAAMGAVFLLGVADLQFDVTFSMWLHTLAKAILSISIMLVCLRIVDMATDFLLIKAEETETKLDDQLIPLANRAAKVIVTALGVLSILDNLGVDITTLLAGVTVSGLAIALAAKDTVENLFGSMMIFIDRPFQIDDYIEVGGTGGTVLEVGFRSTRIRTLIGSIVTIPNASIATAKVDNIGLRHARRLRFTLGFTYAATRTQITDFCDQAAALLAEDERVLEGHEVQFVNFGDSALEVVIHGFLDVPSWTEELRVGSELRMKIWEIADNLELSFAFPSQSLYIEQVPSS